MSAYEIVLETDRLFLRHWQKEDLDALFGMLSDPLNMQHWPKPLSRKETRNWLKHARDEAQMPLPGRLALHLKATGELIGDAGLTRFEINGKRENDLGYIVHHPWWQKGYGTEAACGLLDYGHRVLGLGRIVAFMPEDNIASWRIAESLGMELEGTFHDARNADKLTRLYVSSEPSRVSKSN